MRIVSGSGLGSLCFFGVRGVVGLEGSGVYWGVVKELQLRYHTGFGSKEVYRGCIGLR